MDYLLTSLLTYYGNPSWYEVGHFFPALWVNYSPALTHGDTTIGDNEKDKLIVNATSEFKADATFDKNAHVKGDLQVDNDIIVKGSITSSGDSRVNGNQTVDKDLHVKGDGRFDKDLYVEGVTNTGALVSRGDAAIGGNIAIGENAHVYGSTEIDKNLTVHGETVLDGKFFAKGAARFGDNLDIAKNLTVGGSTAIAQNLAVGGDAKVDGDIYGRSFNVGNERYIDKDGINANGHAVRNVADGKIGPDSMDAVNGRQLHSVRKELNGTIEEVGAQAAAMASLHPLEWDRKDKVSVSSAVGNYKGSVAGAIGAFYRPDKKSLISAQAAIGSNDNMFGIRFSKKLGEDTTEEIEGMTEEELRNKVDELVEKRIDEITSGNASLKKQLAETSNNAVEKATTWKPISNMELENIALKKQLAKMADKYERLLAKVDSLAEKLENIG